MESTLLDADRLCREMLVASVEQHESIGSTNDRAKQLALSGPLRLPVLIVARRQTAGRGRGANRWWTGEGSLAASLLVDLESEGIKAEATGRIALAAGVAVADAVAAHLKSQRVGIHWPNDVYVDQAKVAGILVEVVARRAVIGFGINTNNTARDAPDALAPRAIATIRDLSGRRVDHTGLVTDVLRRMHAGRVAVAASDPTPMRRADQLHFLNGHTVCVDQPSGRTVARCCGIDDDGALRVETAEGEHVFYSGSIRPWE